MQDKCYKVNNCPVCDLDTCPFLKMVEDAPQVKTVMALALTKLAIIPKQKAEFLTRMALDAISPKFDNMSVGDTIDAVSLLLLHLILNCKMVIENDMNEEITKYEEAIKS